MPPHEPVTEVRVAMTNDEWQEMKQHAQSIALFKPWLAGMFTYSESKYDVGDPTRYELHTSIKNLSILNINMGKINRSPKTQPTDIDDGTYRSAVRNKAKYIQLPSEFNMIIEFICRNSAHYIII